MKNQKGFTLIELMAVVCIIAILATISLPVFNHYIEKSKAAAGLAALGTYKNDVAVCFMKDDMFDDCNNGQMGIHEGTDDINWIENVEVNAGTVEAVLTASNHFEEQEHITIHLVPSAHPADAAMNWDIYCSDFNAVAGTHLVDTCIGEIDGTIITPPPPVVDVCANGTIEQMVGCQIDNEFFDSENEIYENVIDPYGVDAVSDENDAMLDYIGIWYDDSLFFDILDSCNIDPNFNNSWEIEDDLNTCLINILIQD